MTDKPKLPRLDFLGRHDDHDEHKPEDGWAPLPRPELTPYDTGERLEPHPWGKGVEPEHYGKVDFDDDESATIATVHFERTQAGYRMVVDCDYDLQIIVNGKED